MHNLCTNKTQILQIHPIQKQVRPCYLLTTRGWPRTPTAEFANTRYTNFVPQSRRVHVLIGDDASREVSWFDHRRRFAVGIGQRQRRRRREHLRGAHRHGISLQGIYRSVKVEEGHNMGRPCARGDEHLCIHGNIDHAAVCLKSSHPAFRTIVGRTIRTRGTGTLDACIVKEGNIQTRVIRTAFGEFLGKTLGACGTRFVLEFGRGGLPPLMEDARFVQCNVLAVESLARLERFPRRYRIIVRHLLLLDGANIGIG
mmetsp:Transcript_35764/g.66256  ORF Transcript_35764/g.66256 Transcript_35764/m.66256 type:complete len:256 (+) Transcript_35764:534-1301(+)